MLSSIRAVVVSLDPLWHVLGFLQGFSYNYASLPQTDGPLRPVVVRQLLDATQEYSGAPFEIEGHEVSYVC